MSKFFKTLVILLLVSNVSLVFAHGRKDVESREVSNKYSWLEQFDLESKKEGKFNIFVTATDMGGNKSVEGPFNIKYDKTSDLPVVGIINPSPDMRVVGNLNIVGTCNDDDGVSKVELILDEGTEWEQTVTAEGTEYWSYYLDTTNLEEGPHTIRVKGFDINDPAKENNPKKIKTDNSTVTWQMDRTQPVTNIEEKVMGTLVSGTVKLNGIVSDGNGIQRLFYSVDNGKTFKELKIKLNKKHPSEATFTLSLDTKKFDDGAKVLWFKAYDNMGSIGLSSYLMFVDNTEPDVKILTPTASDVQNGIFAVAGYAKDVVGIASLSWTFGNDSGNIDIIPGNPYWIVDIDSRKLKEKAGKFTIRAVDSIGNVVDKVLLVPVDQDSDKPVITTVVEPVVDPETKLIKSDSGHIIARGFAVDDDGVDSVIIQLDDNEPQIQKTHGDYSYDFGKVEELAAGRHTIKVTPVDIDGTAGNASVVEFYNKGGNPLFEKVSLINGSETTDFVQGTTIDPESATELAVQIKGSSGIKAVTTKIIFKDVVYSGSEVTDEPKNQPLTYEARLRNMGSLPRGIVYYNVHVTDVDNRESDYTALLYVKNNAKDNAEEEIVFGSEVDANGVVQLDRDHPITAYLAGGNARSVRVLPANNNFGINATLDGNTIRFTYGTHPESVGISDKITVRVTTDKGHTVDSIPLTFSEDTAIPVITLDVQDYDSQLIDVRGNYSTIQIKGKVTCSSKLADGNAVQYRLLEVRPSFDARNVLKSLSAGVAGEFKPVTVNRDGTFTISYDNFDLVERTIERTVFPEDYEFPEMSEDDDDSWGEDSWGAEENAEGAETTETVEQPQFETVTETVQVPGPKANAIYIIEIVATTAGGKKAVTATAINNINNQPKDPNKDLQRANPQTVIISGYEDYAKYGVVAFQGNLVDENGESNVKTFQIFTTDGFYAGQSEDISISATSEYGRTATSNGVIAKNGDLKVNLTSIKIPETSTLYDAETGESSIVTNVKEKSFANGTSLILPQSGVTGSSVTVSIETELAINSIEYEIAGNKTRLSKVPAKNVGEPLLIEIPLNDLPAGENRITVTVRAGNVTKEITGYVVVLREVIEADDEEKIYTFAPSGVEYRASDNTYIIGEGEYFYFYANCVNPIGELTGSTRGLVLERHGNLFAVKATRDGTYRNVVLKVQDQYGDSYNSPALNFISDGQAPVISLLTPEIHSWTGNTLKISGTASDGTGVKAVEYSLDGENWTELTISGPSEAVTFNQEISLEDFADGLVPLTVRAIDNSDQSTYCYCSTSKDVTPPQVEVITPGIDDVVNGQTLVVFKASDDMYIEKIQYQSGDGSIVEDVPYKSLPRVLLGTEDYPMSDTMKFSFEDGAGNKVEIGQWNFIIDELSDLPRTEIHVPEEGEVITRDFVISGVVYDDDGVEKAEDGSILRGPTVYYKIDNGEYKMIPEMGTSYSQPISLIEMTDNEHTVTVYAVDINGIKGEEVSRTFKVSLEEPKGEILMPSINSSVKEYVTISGVASDKNGIKSVQISLDNGNSFNDANGLEEWSYDVDTRILNGGTHAVFLRIVDGYGIQGLYSSLINIDNNSPQLTLEYPKDDSYSTGDILFSGYSSDNVGISELYVTVRNMENLENPFIKNLEIKKIISERVDISSMPDGIYNVELTAKDLAGNTTNVSRNIHLQKNKDPASVDIFYPLNGQHKQGKFSVYGQSESEEKEITLLRLYIDGVVVDETTLQKSGFYKFDVTAETFEIAGETSGKEVSGVHKYHVTTVLSDGMEIPSRDQQITYSPYGPWITIDNFVYGDFATNRPWIKGHAGYEIDPADKELYKSSEASDEFKIDYLNKKLEKIEISFDNGETFKEISTKSSWKYRIENYDIPEGTHFMFIRATMANGEVATNRTLVQVDNTAPSIKMISPVVDGKYNQVLEASGLSSDDVKLEDVTVTLRKGGKSSYEIPSFIQGLYFDFHFLGATFFDVGAGLTFFDDVVKLQVQWGQYTQEQRNLMSSILRQDLTNMRYGGNNVWGVKVLANVYTLPFSLLFGRDFEWLYASLAVGAQFTWFNDGGWKSTTETSISTQTLSAIVVQLEFPLMKFNRKVFSQFSFYTEFSYWFIPTDVSSSSTYVIQNQVPQLAVGLRFNLF